MSDRPMKAIVNCDNGEVVLVELTDEEIAEMTSTQSIINYPEVTSNAD